MKEKSGMRLRAGVATNTGRVRDLNEDAYGLRPEQGLFVVCDGMGGAPAGEVASQIAVDTILAQLNTAAWRAAGSAGGGEHRYLPQTSHLVGAVRRSNQSIYDRAQHDRRQADMGTTVVGAWIEHNIASIAHVGDSRAYLWHDDRLEPLTRDHSLVEAQVGAGLLQREHSLQSEQQNILLRVLGREPDVEVDVNEVPVQVGDYVLLCSDGLTRMIPERTLGEAIVQWRDPQRICESLVDAANRNGGADNITVVVVEVVGTWWRRVWRHWRRQLNGGHRAEAHPAV